MKLKDICIIQSGGTPSRSKKEYWENGTIPWVKISDFSAKHIINTQESITEQGMNCSSAKLFPKGTLLYTIFATIGEVGILDIDATTNQAIVGIMIKNSMVDQEYLYYYLLSLKDYVNRIGRGVAQNNINMSILRELEIPLPPIEKQKKISDIFIQLDKMIEQRQSQIDLIDELVKSRFIEMFGDENNSKKWDIVNVENVADVQVGVVIKPSQYYTDKNEGIKAFRSLNVGEGYIKDSEWVYFSKEGHQKNSKSILKENDLLIVRSGTPGTACVVTKDYVGSNTIDLIIAHPNCEKVNPYYLCTFTNMPHGKKQISEGIGGAAQQHFNVGKYNKLKLMLPPMKIQNKFVEFLRETDKSKLAVQKSLDELETLKKSLMQEYFG